MKNERALPVGVRNSVTVSGRSKGCKAGGGVSGSGIRVWEGSEKFNRRVDSVGGSVMNSERSRISSGSSESVCTHVVEEKSITIYVTQTTIRD